MEQKLHKWEEKNKELCFVNMQKNLPVYNLKTKKEDIMFSNTRLYQADDVNKIVLQQMNEQLVWDLYQTIDILTDTTKSNEIKIVCIEKELLELKKNEM